ncbi:MAG TPA: amino acid adenylation domain-containing protein, partial [Pyrinomonadaceae bacterium]|nr:amino acid adenylation domain-containing protein [Pyrinomonadaceae bacterium]
RVEIEGLIGFFVNMLALRTNVSRNLTFLQLLSRVKEVALGAYAHQDLPFEKLVEKLNPERTVSHTPIFQVMFGMQNNPGETRTLAGLTIKHMPVVSDTAKFDLTLFVTETNTGLNCRFEYNTDLFDQRTIQSLLQRFEILLESIVGNPDEPISRIPLLTATERQLLLVEWNGPRREYPKNECVPELFEAQVARTPDAVAVVCGRERWTYAELNRKSNQLAHYLRGLGVGPEDRVGVCLRRTPAMLVAILGTLKAGGAYVPLDPAYPQERVAFTLQDAEAAVLLTENALLPTLPTTNSRVVCMDSEWPSIAGMNRSNPVGGAHSRNLAYVIYTSGSTGQPKGVAIEHASTVTFLHWALSTFPAADLSAVLFSTSICFDLSVFEMFAPLSSGGKAVLVENALQLADMAAADVTLVNTVPSAMAELARIGAIPPSVRAINLAGEPLPNSLVQDIYRQDSVQRVLNLYGPSEDTTYSTFAPAPKGATEQPPIGRPIANTEVYLLDRDYQPVPIGVPGELHLGGEGLARGYLNRPDLTAERFVPNPFSNRAGDRLYQTGDLARYRPDGSIQFLGRLDHQVKLRGYRIEPGEIETALREHPGIQDAVVVARQSPHGGEHLVGYVVADVNDPQFQSNSDAPQIREHLKKKLPDYMLPGYFVFLEKLPLTPNGKVDRRALPLPNGDRPGPLETHLAPRDDLERRLARIWEKLLGVEVVGIRDDFFELGGHSLLAVRLVSEIEKEVGQRLPLASFFQGANIESLARLLREDVSSISWPTLVEIQPGGLNPPLFCVSHPGVNALGYRSLARHLGPDQPVFGLQSELPEDLEGDYSQAAVDRLALEYLEALRAVRPTGPYQFVGLCRGAHIAFEIARHLEREGQQVALLGILDTWVNENTYNYFWHLEHYWTRLGSVARVGLREQLSFIKKKTRDVLAHVRMRISTVVGKGSVPRKQQNLLHDLYFPGTDFVPHMYEGRIAVFRVSKQPRSRIRDWQLGWGRLAKGGVDVNVIPGGHSSLLKEPDVQGLAAELKKYLVQHPHEPTEE